MTSHTSSFIYVFRVFRERCFHLQEQRTGSYLQPLEKLEIPCTLKRRRAPNSLHLGRLRPRIPSGCRPPGPPAQAGRTRAAYNLQAVRILSIYLYGVCMHTAYKYGVYTACGSPRSNAPQAALIDRTTIAVPETQKTMNEN